MSHSSFVSAASLLERGGCYFFWAGSKLSCASAYYAAMTDETPTEVYELIRTVQRHGAVLNIALAAEDGLAASVATVRARAALERLASVTASNEAIAPVVRAEIERTLGDYDRLYAAALVINTVEDRIRMLSWLEHRSRRDLDLFELDVRNKHLGMMSFANLRLSRCRLAGVAIAGSLFDCAELEDCDLSMSDLARTSWAGTRATRCTFTDANLTDSTLDGAKFVDCVFLRTDLGATQLNRAVTARQSEFVRCDLRGSCWHERVLAGTRFDACSFLDSYGRPLLEGVEIERPDFSVNADRTQIGSTRDVIEAWYIRGPNSSDRWRN